MFIEKGNSPQQMIQGASSTRAGSTERPAGPRRRGRPPGRTAEGKAQRDRLYRIAIDCITEQGYEGTTLREIARRAEVSPGLLYRYFPNKAALVLALHEELSAAFEDRARAMPDGRWRARFRFCLDTSLEVLAAHRATLANVIPLLVSRQEGSVLSHDTLFARERVEGAFVRAVTGASDAPGGKAAAALGRTLYVAHLGILLWWVLDRSPKQAGTRLLLAFVDRALGPLALALRLPPTRRLVTQFDRAAALALWSDPRDPRTGDAVPGKLAP